METRGLNLPKDSEVLSAIDFSGNTYGFLVNDEDPIFGIIEIGEFSQFIKLSSEAQSGFIECCGTADYFHLFIH